MTLSGTKKPPVQFLGVFDPVVAHPLAAIIGVGIGLFLGFRKRRR